MAFKTRTNGCVQWIPRTTESDYVTIKGASTGCWSYVGRLGRGEQGLNSTDIWNLWSKIGCKLGIRHYREIHPVI